MGTDKRNIRPYNDTFKKQVLSVWERSVLATHEFLSQTDFDEIKELVQSFNFNDIQVYCLTENDMVFGFIGVVDRKIEMLFVDPNYFGQGLGKVLMDFAINELTADKVDVNEQNVKAIKFYQKLGFEIYERTDKDDQGRNYPLLRMKLK